MPQERARNAGTSALHARPNSSVSGRKPCEITKMTMHYCFTVGVRFQKQKDGRHMRRPLLRQRNCRGTTTTRRTLLVGAAALLVPLPAFAQTATQEKVAAALAKLK